MASSLLSRTLAKAGEYRRLALEAAVHARASGLDHVREKHETVAVHWTALAVFEEERGSELS